MLIVFFFIRSDEQIQRDHDDDSGANTRE